MRIEKEKCEVCKETNKSVLHIHHIIPRRDPRCTNNLNNLAVLCANCHSKVHAGQIIIIGRYFSTAGSIILWFNKGEKPPFPKEEWKIKYNPLVITHEKKNEDD